MDQRISPSRWEWQTWRERGRSNGALGWTAANDDPDVVFYQAGGMVFALWGRDDLATDSGVRDRGGFWGGYSGVFVDPDGHPWEVAHNPGWTFGADGSVHVQPPS